MLLPRRIGCQSAARASKAGASSCAGFAPRSAAKRSVAEVKAWIAPELGVTNGTETPSASAPATAVACSASPVWFGRHSTATEACAVCTAAEQIAQPTARGSLWVASCLATSPTASRFAARRAEATVSRRRRAARASTSRPATRMLPIVTTQRATGVGPVSWVSTQP